MMIIMALMMRKNDDNKASDHAGQRLGRGADGGRTDDGAAMQMINNHDEFSLLCGRQN